MSLKSNTYVRARIIQMGRATVLTAHLSPCSARSQTIFLILGTKHSHESYLHIGKSQLKLWSSHRLRCCLGDQSVVIIEGFLDGQYKHVQQEICRRVYT